MKKLLVMMLVGMMSLSIGMVSNAEEPELTATVVETYQNTRETLLEKYYPEGLETLVALEAEHETFHSQRAALREERVAVYKAEFEAFREMKLSIQSDYEAGHISKEEARTEGLLLKEDFELKKEELSTLRAEIDVIIEEKIIANNALKAQRDEYRQIIREELQKDTSDEIIIADALQEGLDLLAEHIELDYYYAGLVDAVIGE